MLAVVDANVVISALVGGGKTLKVFEWNNLLMTFEFISPEYLFFEVGRRMDKILRYTRLSREEFIKAFSFVKEEIELMPMDTFRDKTEEAREKSPHMKDIPYVALALKLDCKILSGDKGLKDNIPDRVFSPSEAMDAIFGKKGA